jgi:hypothetical protein
MDDKWAEKSTTWTMRGKISVVTKNTSHNMVYPELQIIFKSKG